MKNSIYIKDVIPVQLCHFLTHVLLRYNHEMTIQNISFSDNQVENCLAYVTNNIFLDTIGERIWPFLENIIGEELYPTYTYARLYTNGNVLEKHIDRPSCEISITIQLGRSHNYSWPIYAGNDRFDLQEGDGVLYKGCEVEHWRNMCDGPEGYYSGQLFCHFVRANGPYSNFIGDNRWNKEIPYKRFRTLQMETK